MIDLLKRCLALLDGKNVRFIDGNLETERRDVYLKLDEHIREAEQSFEEMDRCMTELDERRKDRFRLPVLK